MEAFPPHLAQGLSSQVEQDSQPAFALFRWEQQRSQRRIKNKPLQAFLLHGCSQPQWVGGMGHFIPPHGAARGASSSSDMETPGESVWEYRKRWEEMLFFPLSSFNPGRQQAHNILWRKLTLYQPNPVPLISPPSSTSSWQMRGDNQGEWKGGIKGKALFSPLRVQGLVCVEQSSLAAPWHTLCSCRNDHLLWLWWLRTRHSRKFFSVPQKCSQWCCAEPSFWYPFLWPLPHPGADPELLHLQTKVNGQKLPNSERKKIAFSTKESWGGWGTTTNKLNKNPCWQQLSLC